MRIGNKEVKVTTRMFAREETSVDPPVVEITAEVDGEVVRERVTLGASDAAPVDVSEEGLTRSLEKAQRRLAEIAVRRAEARKNMQKILGGSQPS